MDSSTEHLRQREDRGGRGGGVPSLPPPLDTTRLQLHIQELSEDALKTSRTALPQPEIIKEKQHQEEEGAGTQAVRGLHLQHSST